MAVDSAQTVLGAGGAAYLAPVGTTPPADLTTAWAAAWKDLGYIDENGLSLGPGLTLQEFLAWQAFYPIRRAVTGQTLDIGMALEQWNTNNVQGAFGGGSVAVVGGVSTYTPPDFSVIQEKALGIEVDDGSRHFRWVFKRVMVTALGTIQFARGSLSKLEPTFSLLASSGVAPFTFITDDATAFVAG